MAVVTIEKLLHWAFVEQMPTPDAGALMNVGDFGPWSAIVRVGELGTLVDRSRNLDPGPAWTIVDPDPDAVTIVNAVAALDELDVVEEEAHDLMAGWPDFGDVGEACVAKAWDVVSYRDAAGRRVLRSPLSLLVRRVAVLGEWPKWKCEAPKVEFVRLPKANTPSWFRVVRQAVEWNEAGESTRWVDVEVDGFNRSTRRPYSGAYRKFCLVPDVAGALAARIEYGLTYAALEQLACYLNGLGGRSILPMTVSPMPWA